MFNDGLKINLQHFYGPINLILFYTPGSLFKYGNLNEQSSLYSDFKCTNHNLSFVLVQLLMCRRR